MAVVVPKLIPHAGGPWPMGAQVVSSGINFAVYSERAEIIWVSFFDADDAEIARIALDGREGDVHFGLIVTDPATLKYGLRADGPYDPDKGLYFDLDKLLLDPYARRIDRAFAYDPKLGAARGNGTGGADTANTASLMPKAMLAPSFLQARHPFGKDKNGLIYELNVKGYTKRHNGVPEALRGTVKALTTPEVMAHILDLGVEVLELMPIAAWIDERHLVAQGLRNGWGYNPVGYFAPDPRLLPNGIADLRAMTDAYRAVDVPVILDVVYNHTGESDLGGPVLSMKGLDAHTYYRHVPEDENHRLANDTGTGNTLRTDHKIVQNLVIESLRFWLEQGGVSGFRFDLAPVLGRDENGFSPDRAMLERIKDDPVLKQCILIAEPWDPGPGGYQLGQFGAEFSEWNDKYRDDVRAYWRGDAHKVGALATRLAGSDDVFTKRHDVPSRGVNFLSVHDGFTLADQVAYVEKRNMANGENNRDGHSHNLSWNNGVEGPSNDADVLIRRQRDVRAMLATLFVSRGKILLQQGDEFGRSQAGNNNAYAQDNETTWLDWDSVDSDLVDFVAKLNRFQTVHPAIHADRFLAGASDDGRRDVRWLHPHGREMINADWHGVDDLPLGMHLVHQAESGWDEVLVWFNRGHQDVGVQFLQPNQFSGWSLALQSVDHTVGVETACEAYTLLARSVTVFVGN